MDNLLDRRQSNLKVKKRNAWRYRWSEAQNSFLAAASPACRVLYLDLLARIAVPGNLSSPSVLFNVNCFGDHRAALRFEQRKPTLVRNHLLLTVNERYLTAVLKAGIVGGRLELLEAFRRQVARAIEPAGKIIHLLADPTNGISTNPDPSMRKLVDLLF